MAPITETFKSIRERIKTVSLKFFTPKEFRSILIFVCLGLTVLLYRSGKYLLHQYYPASVSQEDKQQQQVNDSTFGVLSRKAAYRDSLQFWIPEDSLEHAEQLRSYTKSKKELLLKEQSISLNFADSSTFQKLPGIGEKMAQRIVQYRSSRGKFRDLRELMNVQGIGEVKFKRMQPYLKLN